MRIGRIPLIVICLLTVLLIAALLPACNTLGLAPKQAKPPLEVDSLSFTGGEAIPVKYTCDGEDISPELHWSGAYSSTKSYALVVYDTEAPTGPFYHWLVYNIPRGTYSLPEGISGKELTDWLRVKYNIAQHNCIPHGLASVNPETKLIGHHLDLSHGFPFHRFDLTNKYNEPLPSIIEFGFGHDQYLVEVFNGKPWRGVQLSQALLKAEARHHQMAFSRFRKKRQQQFAKMFSLEKELKQSYSKDSRDSEKKDPMEAEKPETMPKKDAAPKEDTKIFDRKEKVALF